MDSVPKIVSARLALWCYCLDGARSFIMSIAVCTKASKWSIVRPKGRAVESNRCAAYDKSFTIAPREKRS